MKGILIFTGMALMANMGLIVWILVAGNVSESVRLRLMAIVIQSSYLCSIIVMGRCRNNMPE